MVREEGRGGWDDRRSNKRKGEKQDFLEEIVTYIMSPEESPE